MSKLTIREQLENPKLRENLLEKILVKIQQRKIKATQKEAIALAVALYGSKDKIPSGTKKILGLK